MRRILPLLLAVLLSVSAPAARAVSVGPERAATVTAKQSPKKVLKIAARKYPRAVLILVGPLDTYGGYDDSIPIRDALKSAAKKLDVPFVDDMTWTAGHDEWLCDDYVHPTYAAEVLLGERLAKALRKRGA